MCTALTLRACRSARSFLCPYDGCDFASLTSDDAVWAHAEEEHGIERDRALCLWDGCNFGRKQPKDYLRHVGQHNGVWPAHCPTCGKGHQKQSAPPLTPASRAFPS